MVKIYILIDPITNEIRYVGKTVSTLNQRLNGHVHEAKTGVNFHKKHWFAKLEKQGLKPIIKQIDEVEDADWKEKERYYISLYKQTGNRLINLLEGGNGFTSNDVKKLWKNKKYRFDQTERMKGTKNPFYGKKHSNETKQILSTKCGKVGKNHPLYGTHLSKKTKEKVRLNQPNRKPIQRMDLDGNILDKWDGIRKMCRELNLDMAAVKRVILGKNKHHRGFTFSFI